MSHRSNRSIGISLTLLAVSVGLHFVAAEPSADAAPPVVSAGPPAVASSVASQAVVQVDSRFEREAPPQAPEALPLVSRVGVDLDAQSAGVDERAAVVARDAVPVAARGSVARRMLPEIYAGGFTLLSPAARPNTGPAGEPEPATPPHSEALPISWGPPAPRPPAPKPRRLPLVIWGTGVFEQTDRSMDVAIDGRGFFVLGGAQYRTYTRWGQFNFDVDGRLITGDGRRVQGFGIDPVTGLSNGELGNLHIFTAISPARATSTLDLSVNLAASDPIQAGGFDPSKSRTSPSHAVPVNVYDSLGNRHSLSVFFSRTANNTWEWNAALATADTTTPPASPRDPWVVQGSGTLAFDATGALTGATGTSFSLDFAGGAAAPQPLTLGFTNAGMPTTQFSVSSAAGWSIWWMSASQTNSFSQDGFAAGGLQMIAIDPHGIAWGIYSSGKSLALAQLALATFWNPDGLEAVDGVSFVATPASGDAHIATPMSDRLGSIRSGTLEHPDLGAGQCIPSSTQIEAQQGGS